MTSPNQLRENIKFQRRSGTPDGYGNQLGNWADLAGPMRARIRPINGKEEVLVGKLSGVQPFEILTRSSTETRTITTQDRIVNIRTGVHYDITAIQNPDERNVYLSFLAKTGGAET